MAEHLYAHRLTLRPAHMLLDDLLMQFLHLTHIQLAGQHAHISKLTVELQGFNVGYVELRREVHFHTALPAIAHHGNV